VYLYVILVFPELLPNSNIKHYSVFYLLGKLNVLYGTPPPTNVKCPGFLVLKKWDSYSWGIVTATVRPRSIPQLSQCDLQAEGKFNPIY
jgi:hypothetical protein